MSTNAYRYKSLRYGYGRNEILICECKTGIELVPSSALVLVEQTSSGFEWKKYVLRMDASRLAISLKTCLQDSEKHRRLCKLLEVKVPSASSETLLRFGADNVSPSLWDNGFGICYYLAATIHVSLSKKQELKDMISGEFYVDECVKCFQRTSELVAERLSPALDYLTSLAPAAEPAQSDF